MKFEPRTLYEGVKLNFSDLKGLGEENFKKLIDSINIPIGENVSSGMDNVLLPIVCVAGFGDMADLWDTEGTGAEVIVAVGEGRILIIVYEINMSTIVKTLEINLIYQNGVQVYAGFVKGKLSPESFSKTKTLIHNFVFKNNYGFANLYNYATINEGIDRFLSPYGTPVKGTSVPASGTKIAEHVYRYNREIESEYAVRDEKGRRIDTTYAEKYDVDRLSEKIHSIVDGHDVIIGSAYSLDDLRMGGGYIRLDDGGVGLAYEEPVAFTVSEAVTTTMSGEIIDVKLGGSIESNNMPKNDSASKTVWKLCSSIESNPTPEAGLASGGARLGGSAESVNILETSPISETPAVLGGSI